MFATGTARFFHWLGWVVVIHLREANAENVPAKAYGWWNEIAALYRVVVRSSLVADAGVFGVGASFADVEIERDAEVFRFRIGGGFYLDDDGVVLTGGQRGF